MRLGGIGVGQAGGKILDLLAYHDTYGQHHNILPFAIAVNSARSDLMGLKIIPKNNQILVGQTEVRGHGVGLRREIGAKVIEQQLHLIMRSVAEKGLYRVDAFLVIAGLGGGTGSGGVPLVVEQLKSVYDQPVFALGVIPSSEEGKLMTDNARQAIKELHKVADGILLFDNEVWKKEGIPIQECYKTMNYELIKPIPYLMGAGEVSGNKVGIKVVDASDIMATWKDIAYIGYSELKAKTLKKQLNFFKRRTSIDELDPVLATLTVVKNAAGMRLSGICGRNQATKALMLIAGPSGQLNMEGFSQAKSWLQNYIGESGEIRGGDYPLENVNELSGIVMLAGITEIPRIGLSLSHAASSKKAT
ncbi:MAG: cell division protein [Dehalococcoidia bacterium]